MLLGTDQPPITRLTADAIPTALINAVIASEHNSRMSNKGKRSVVRVKFGPDIPPQLVAEVKRVRGLPPDPQFHPTPGVTSRRVEAFRQTVNDLVPAGTIVSIWPAIEMATTLAHVTPGQFGPGSGAAYTTERGANIAMAKTLRRPDGSFDIVVDANLFVHWRENTDANAAAKEAALAHLAAHEPQHVILTLAGLGPEEVAEAARGESPTISDFVPVVAESVNEYQCELAANRVVVSMFPHDATALAQDLEKFRESLTLSIDTAGSNRYEACAIVLTAVKELVKGVAYAAAYRFYDGRDDRSGPDPKPEQWDRYMSDLWPDLLDLFASIPAAGELIEVPVLSATVYKMSERVLRWLEGIGVTYVVEVQNGEQIRSCWWDVPEPI